MLRQVQAVSVTLDTALDLPGPVVQLMKVSPEGLRT